MKRTVWNTGGCDSWYLDANGVNTTVWPGTTTEFRRATRRIDLAEYEVLRPPVEVEGESRADEGAGESRTDEVAGESRTDKKVEAGA